MGLLQYFTPDGIKKDIYGYTAEFFLKKNVRRVVFDLDNTLAPYSVPRPDDKLKGYFKGLRDFGIDLMIVSNNNEKRVAEFNAELGLFCVSNAKKPRPGAILKCIGQSAAGGKAALVGDQIFTDCLAARRAGIYCFLVKPIQPRENLFFKFKRLCERPFIKRFKGMNL